MGRQSPSADVDGSAQYCAFNDGDRTVTQLKTVSKLQKTSINLLANHNMESSASWTMGTGASYSTADQFMGSKKPEAERRECGGFAGGDAHTGQNVHTLCIL